MSTMRRVIRPAKGSAEAMALRAAIYRAGRTPVEDGRGGLSSMDARPADAASTATHLRTLYDEGGQGAVGASYAGLRATRGAEFARASMAHAGFAPGLAAGPGGALGGDVLRDIGASRANRELPRALSGKLQRTAGLSFGGVRVHDDAAAHRAADRLNARAFAVGQSIYFGSGEWQPDTRAGFALIAHEAAHTVQQRGTSAPAQSLRVGDPAGAGEVEASHFADAVESGGTMRSFTPTQHAGRVQRALSFAHGSHTLTRHPIAATETAGSFRIEANPGPGFRWDANVTIHGSAGDPFANFEAGSLQIVRASWSNIFWGSGTNQTRRRRILPTPVRDAETAGSTFASASAPFTTARFTADGDVRSPAFEDTPGETVEWGNPVPPRVSHTGLFDMGNAFVTYIGVRNTALPITRAAFTILASRYWNESAGGSWDDARAVGTRITFTTGPSANTGGVIDGESGADPAIIGGPIANDVVRSTTT